MDSPKGICLWVKSLPEYELLQSAIHVNDPITANNSARILLRDISDCVKEETEFILGMSLPQKIFTFQHGLFLAMYMSQNEELVNFHIEMEKQVEEVLPDLYPCWYEKTYRK